MFEWEEKIKVTHVPIQYIDAVVEILHQEKDPAEAERKIKAFIEAKERKRKAEEEVDWLQASQRHLLN